MNFSILNHFTSHLPADTVTENYVRKVFNSAYSFVNPTIPSNPSLIHVSENVAKMLGFTTDFVNSKDFIDYFSGKVVIPNAKPYAMAYAGHQFGNWAGQLGDGRAINLGEIIAQNQQYTLQLKGAGKTPYSRTADGLAVLRSSLREHLCSEAMHYLGIPTTRSLALFNTGDLVLRDMLYDGHPDYEQGAIVCRVAPSFIRFGNFELFASRNEKELLQQLVNYTVDTHFPEITTQGVERVIQFFHAVMKKTLHLIIQWQRVGFVHGVMNTDNMSIHGITIDYGPYGWLDHFNPTWTPNTTDRHERRYRYENQPNSAVWNLIQLANALYMLVGDAKPFQDSIDNELKLFQQNVKEMWNSKLGIQHFENGDDKLTDRLHSLLYTHEVDMTIFYRLLSDFKETDAIDLKVLDHFEKAFYNKDLVFEHKELWLQWLIDYSERLQKQGLDFSTKKEKMNKVNPKYVLRNYMSYLAIQDAEQQDYGLLNELFTMLTKPYDEQPEYDKWFTKIPHWALEKVGSSMLSCSS